MTEEPPRGGYAIKYVCMYVCVYVCFEAGLLKNTRVDM